jgi:hypothetical protein
VSLPFNWTKRWSKRGSEDLAAGEGRLAEEIAEPVEVEVEVAPLPCWEGLGEEGRRRAVLGLVEEVEAELAQGTSRYWERER